MAAWAASACESAEAVGVLPDAPFGDNVPGDVVMGGEDIVLEREKTVRGRKGLGMCMWKKDELDVVAAREARK